MEYEVIVGDRTYLVEIETDGRVLLDGEPLEVDFRDIGQSGLYSLLVNNESFEALVEQVDWNWQVLLRGTLYEVTVIDERSRLLRSRAINLVPETGEVPIKAPMPGLVVATPVEVGQQVEMGDNVVILESMKMENELKAPRAGRVERINVKPGDSVEQNQTLVVIV
ncbi:MAG TPA: biotin/lipoyl-binding protein [Aggregatilineales bacterium]|nr:biotin/lipoyl-binding protein [Chloroflexota bacterium]HOA23481.1 biotin/lipoyl-binding protein [Aggregatilineales bacterium]HPV06267.1 biotin/lipoyl-binding protein [Aggregatilineales bacterium]HQA69074.1 biotin/lipoyl-binding protein [Aggregatilineales bacterium]